MVRSRLPDATPAGRHLESPPGGREWALFLWRLPTGSSTRRVSVWRQLRRLGAATLTPGAALLPWEDELVEQLDWLAQEVDEDGGDAWVLRAGELSETDERRVIDDCNRERGAEYAAIRETAKGFLERLSTRSVTGDDHLQRLRTERELVALQRRFRKVRDRDHFDAPGRIQAAAAVDRCLRHRQGISTKLTAMTDSRETAR